ncbi:hypothetical protein [Rhodovulum sp. YEN HP10]|uniref:hypothetical protein n=1 Tax=Rhodovulum sp. HP10 TaxID=3387397 RepID=UPI0039E193DA
MENLEKSEIVISKILSLLMEWGIRECELEFEELELDDEFRFFFFPCIEWLTDEGVIRTGEIHGELGGTGCGSVMNPVLTSYGLNVLGTRIQLGETEEKLSDAVKKVSAGSRSYAQFGDFVGGLLGGFTKSIGS